MNQDTFDTALVTFVEGCKRINHEHMTEHFSNVPLEDFRVTKGKRYIRVVRREPRQQHGSVHCFVDTTNGDVLKAAGWKAPAKHARGNIFDEHNGLGSMNEYGPAYLR